MLTCEVNHGLTNAGKPAASQEQTCISKQSEDDHDQERQQADNNIVMKQLTNDNLPNLDNLLAKLRSITHNYVVSVWPCCWQKSSIIGSQITIAN